LNKWQNDININPLTPTVSIYEVYVYMGKLTATKHPVPHRVSRHLNFWHPGTLTLNHERQSAQMATGGVKGLIRRM